MRIRIADVKRIGLNAVGIIGRMPRSAVKPPPELLPMQQNLADLIARSGLNVNAWSARHKLLQSTVYRIVNGKQDPTTSVVQTIAEALGLEPWQLSAPDLGAHLYKIENGRVVPIRVVPALDEKRPELLHAPLPTPIPEPAPKGNELHRDGAQRRRQAVPKRKEK